MDKLILLLLVISCSVVYASPYKSESSTLGEWLLRSLIEDDFDNIKQKNHERRNAIESYLLDLEIAKRQSWDSYIDNLIAHTSGACDKAAIIGINGDRWTTDGHPNALKMSTTEAATIARAFDSGDFSGFQASGIRIGGIKYLFLRDDGKVVLGKKRGNGAITMQKSSLAIVIGHTKEGASQGNTNKGVEVIADYLESLGM